MLSFRRVIYNIVFLFSLLTSLALALPGKHYLVETEDEDGDSYEDGPEDAGDGTGGMRGLHKVQYFIHEITTRYHKKDEKQSMLRDVTFPKGHRACCTKLGQ